MNFVHIGGHLGADPEVRFTSSGQKVTTLRVAGRVRRSGEDKTIWWTVTLWGEQFDKIVAYLKKGSAVVVVGEMDMPEIFNDREGNARISMRVTACSVTFSPFGRSQREEERGESLIAAGIPSKESSSETKEDEILEDEVPF